MKKFSSFGFGLALLAILLSFTKINYSQDDSINVKTELVTVPATIIDKQGRYVTNLKKENVQLFEDGVEQEIAIFEPVEQPVTVILLADTSLSMKDRLKEVSAAVNAFIRQLKPEDTLTVASFSNEVDYLIKPIKVKDLKKTIKFIFVSSLDFYKNKTKLYTAVNSALKKAEKIDGRKAIIVFSDGLGNELNNAKWNFEKAMESEAVIYTMQFDTWSEMKSKVTQKSVEELETKSTNYMQKLADLTGGRRFPVTDISDLEKTFAQVAVELSQQYRLGYYPKEVGKNGERRQIKVRVNIPNTVVRTRESYTVK